MALLDQPHRPLPAVLVQSPHALLPDHVPFDDTALHAVGYIGPPPAQLVVPTGTAVFSSVRLIGAASVPSVRSVQLVATTVPFGRTYGTVDRLKRVAGDPADVASHARYVPVRPPAVARAWHSASAPVRPPIAPVYIVLVTNTVRVHVPVVGVAAAVENAAVQYPIDSSLPPN